MIAIAAGYDHSLALKADGTVVAWGRNQNGQCNVPVPLPFVSSIAAGWYHTAAVVQGGGVVAWGLNDRGQCNVPQPLAPCVNLAAGDYHTVVVLGPDCNSNGIGDVCDIASALSLDCDGDALLLSVDQTGPACHTGNHSCFDAHTLPVGSNS